MTQIRSGFDSKSLLNPSRDGGFPPPLMKSHAKIWEHILLFIPKRDSVIKIEPGKQNSATPNETPFVAVSIFPHVILASQDLRLEKTSNLILPLYFFLSLFLHSSV